MRIVRSFTSNDLRTARSPKSANHWKDEMVHQWPRKNANWAKECASMSMTSSRKTTGCTCKHGRLVINYKQAGNDVSAVDWTLALWRAVTRTFTVVDPRISSILLSFPMPLQYSSIMHAFVRNWLLLPTQRAFDRLGLFWRQPTITAAYHFASTDVNSMVPNHRIPFSSLALFEESHTLKFLHCRTFVLESITKIVSGFIHKIHVKFLNHFSHSGLRLVLHHPPAGPECPVHNDLHLLPHPVLDAVSPSSLFWTLYVWTCDVPSLSSGERPDHLWR